MTISEIKKKRGIKTFNEEDLYLTKVMNNKGECLMKVNVPIKEIDIQKLNKEMDNLKKLLRK